MANLTTNGGAATHLHPCLCAPLIFLFKKSTELNGPHRSFKAKPQGQMGTQRDICLMSHNQSDRGRTPSQTETLRLLGALFPHPQLPILH